MPLHALRFELEATLPTTEAGGDAPEVKPPSFGQGVRAQEVKVELHRVVHDTAQVTDNDMDVGDTSGVGTLAMCDGDTQDVFGDGQLVHSGYYTPIRHR
jgi:hypothetical protein